MCIEFLKIVLNLKYDEEINYENLENIFRDAITRINKKPQQPGRTRSILSRKERDRLNIFLNGS